MGYHGVSPLYMPSLDHFISVKYLRLENLEEAVRSLAVALKSNTSIETINGLPPVEWAESEASGTH